MVYTTHLYPFMVILGMAYDLVYHISFPYRKLFFCHYNVGFSCKISHHPFAIWCSPGLHGLAPLDIGVLAARPMAGACQCAICYEPCVSWHVMARGHSLGLLQFYRKCTPPIRKETLGPLGQHWELWRLLFLRISRGSCNLAMLREGGVHGDVLQELHGIFSAAKGVEEAGDQQPWD